jgi:hypothetical protein
VLLVDLIGRNTIDAIKFDRLVPSLAHINEYLKEQIIIEAKYYRYIQKQQKQIEKMKKMLKAIIPADFSYKGLPGLSNEVIEKHNNKKLDSPSGTAKTLIEKIQNSLPEPRTLVHGRDGMAKRDVPTGDRSLQGGSGRPAHGT